MSYTSNAGDGLFSLNFVSSTTEFWNSLGFDVNYPEQVAWLEDQLQETKVINYSEGPERNVAKFEDEHKGIISAQEARKLLGDEVSDGIIELLLIDRGSIPHESYWVSADLEPKPEDRGQAQEYLQNGTLMVEAAENSPGAGYYDVLPVGYQSMRGKNQVQRDFKELEDNLDDILN